MKNGRQHRVLVAGGAGFLGSHPSDVLLASGEAAVCLDSSRMTVGDLVGRVTAMTGPRSPVVRLPLPVADPFRRRRDMTREAERLGRAPQA